MNTELNSQDTYTLAINDHEEILETNFDSLERVLGYITVNIFKGEQHDIALIEIKEQIQQLIDAVGIDGLTADGICTGIDSLLAFSTEMRNYLQESVEMISRAQATLNFGSTQRTIATNLLNGIKQSYCVVPPRKTWVPGHDENTELANDLGYNLLLSDFMEFQAINKAFELRLERAIKVTDSMVKSSKELIAEGCNDLNGFNRITTNSEQSVYAMSVLISRLKNLLEQLVDVAEWVAKDKLLINQSNHAARMVTVTDKDSRNPVELVYKDKKHAQYNYGKIEKEVKSIADDLTSITVVLEGLYQRAALINKSKYSYHRITTKCDPEDGEIPPIKRLVMLEGATELFSKHFLSPKKTIEIEGHIGEIPTRRASQWLAATESKLSIEKE